MGIYQKIASLLAKKYKIEKEIVSLQNSCKHNKKSIKTVLERVDSSSPVVRYVCDECSKILGYPNQQDIDNFFKE